MVDPDDATKSINSITGNTPDNTPTEFYEVTAVDAALNTITINYNSTDNSTYERGGAVSKVIEFNAALNEFNPWREQGRQCYLKEIEFLVDTDGGSLRVDVSDNTSEKPWLEDILILPDSTQKQRQFVKLSIENVADFHTITMKQLSAVNQVKITSIRIRAEMGGITND